VTSTSPPKPPGNDAGDEPTVSEVPGGEQPTASPPLPDIDGDDTLLLDGLPATGAGDQTVHGLGAPEPIVRIHQSNEHIATFETLDDVAAATALTAHESADDADLDEKIRRHLSEGHIAEDPLIGSVIGNRFEVMSKIGAGGMGAVYQARQRGMGRDVAIKVLHQAMAQNETITRRFTIEALAVSRLKHPNTIQIFDFGRTDRGNLYIAMELLEGVTLNGLLKEHGRLPIRRALRIIAAAASSLAEAHGKEIIHRDLKPENIFLTRVGDDPDHVKVLDFGVAKLRDGAGDGKGTLTKAGSIFGTPRYMSPEQASARPLDARSDLYSLGVILYELICGDVPFDDEQPLQLLIAHANRPPPPPSSICLDLAIPKEVEDLIMQLLDKSPHTRVQTARELSSLCLKLAARLPDEFEESVPFEGADRLSVELSTPATLSVPRAGDGLETLDVDAPVTLAAEVVDSPTVIHEPEPPPPRRTSWILLGIGAAGIGLLAVVVGLQSAPLTADNPPPSTALVETTTTVDPPAVPAPAMALPAESTTVTVGVLSRPAGASVYQRKGKDLGELIGTAPIDIVRPRGTRLAIRVQTGDHVPIDRELTFDRDTALDLTLLPLGSPSAKSASKSNRKGSARVRRSGKGSKADRGPPKADKPADKVDKPPVKPKADNLVDDLM